MPDNLKAKGEKAEAAILAALIERDVVVSLPFGDNQRYDMILDAGGRLWRAQCKLGWRTGGNMRFATQSMRLEPDGWVGRNYIGQADLFLVWEPTARAVYVHDVATAPKSSCVLRVDPTRNCQESGVKWASDHELDGWLAGVVQW